MRVNCKDYDILRIPQYNRDGLNIKDHKNFNDFYWDFIEKVTGKTIEEFFNDYGMRSNDMRVKYLTCDHDIFVIDHWDRWKVFMLPKANPVLKQMMLELLQEHDLNFKILKRVNTPYISVLKIDSREAEKKLWQKTKKKYSL